MSTTRSRRAGVAAVLSAPILLTAVAPVGPASAEATGPPSAVARPAVTDPPIPTDQTPPRVMAGTAWQLRIETQMDRATGSPRYPGDARIFHKGVTVGLIWWQYKQPYDESIRYDLYRLWPSPTRLYSKTTQTGYTTTHTDQS